MPEGLVLLVLAALVLPGGMARITRLLLGTPEAPPNTAR